MREVIGIVLFFAVVVVLVAWIFSPTPTTPTTRTPPDTATAARALLSFSTGLLPAPTYIPFSTPSLLSADQVLEYHLSSSGGVTRVVLASTGQVIQTLDQYRYYRGYIGYDGRLRFLYQTRHNRNVTAIAWENPHRYAFSWDVHGSIVSSVQGVYATHLTDYLEVPWASSYATFRVTVPFTSVQNARYSDNGTLICREAPTIRDQVFYTIDWDGYAHVYDVYDCEVRRYGHWQQALLRFVNNQLAENQPGDVLEDRTKFGENVSFKWDFNASLLPAGSTTVYEWQLVSVDFGGTLILPTFEDLNQWSDRLSTDTVVVPWTQERNFYHIYIRPI